MMVSPVTRCSGHIERELNAAHQFAPSRTRVRLAFGPMYALERPARPALLYPTPLLEEKRQVGAVDLGT